MTWSRVKWSEAHQVLDLMDAPRAGRPAGAAAAPETYFAHLRHQGDRRTASDFLAQALPRLEALTWAARCVRDSEGREDGNTPSGRALRSVLLWLQDPNDNRRRAAYEAASAAELKGPEALAALAVFYSGGSIAPATNPPIAPPKGVSGRFAALAVRLAAARAADKQAALDRALDFGAAIAEHGISVGA